MDVALSSSLYMRKRLPQPKARIETFAPVRPRGREGIGSVPGLALAMSFSNKRLVPAAAPNPTFSRNCRREISLLMVPPELRCRVRGAKLKIVPRFRQERIVRDSLPEQVGGCRAKQVADFSGPGFVAESADDAGRSAVELAADESGGAGQFVGDGLDAGAKLVTVGVATAAI